ncbi:unnamed protein product [Trichobilharzia regenti]|nr:unnamed protein product [Trichobilharzia regenti]
MMKSACHFSINSQFLIHLITFYIYTCILHRITTQTMVERKAVIKNADMHEDMQEVAVHTAVAALDKYEIEKDIAAYVKKEFDRKYNPNWHCIVGKHFGR